MFSQSVSLFLFLASFFLASFCLPSVCLPDTFLPAFLFFSSCSFSFFLALCFSSLVIFLSSSLFRLSVLCSSSLLRSSSPPFLLSSSPPLLYASLPSCITSSLVPSFLFRSSFFLLSLFVLIQCSFFLVPFLSGLLILFSYCLLAFLPSVFFFFFRSVCYGFLFFLFFFLFFRFVVSLFFCSPSYAISFSLNVSPLLELLFSFTSSVS